MSASVSKIGPGWLHYEDGNSERILIWVVGAVHDSRAEELWSTIEGALEGADGRSVTVDLRRMSGFGPRTLELLALVARASRRRHEDLQLVARPGSIIVERLREPGIAPLAYDDVQDRHDGPPVACHNERRRPLSA